MRKINILILILALPATILSQTPTKTDKIKELLELTGSSKLGTQVVNSMISLYKKSYPTIDTAFWNEVAMEFQNVGFEELMIPIYAKYYTEEDIDQLIAFYNTPIGIKVIQNMPAIAQESMVAGQLWGKMIGEKVVEKLCRLEN